MRIYKLPVSFSGESFFLLSPKESRYLVSVLRFPEGKTFSGRDASGTPWLLTLQKVGASYGLRCTPATEDDATENAADAMPLYTGFLPAIHLFPCLLKGKKLEGVIRQACEMGVRRITPVHSAHCVASFVDDEKRNAGKIQRFEAQVREAVQQSGSRIITEVTPAIPFSDIPTAWGSSGPGLFFHQGQNDALSFGQRIALIRNHVLAGAPLAIVIGPEGGLSPEECALLEASGFHGVLLKTNILRAETAAIYAIAAAQSLLLEA
ncbi:RsmE family RNA methyltransferase [Parasphaerochaeta coccoides]|uniref:Ribosomal RNA small subunit methyltransferase E n=1 Tax=Parasphaerochaeta coccoides (strain ATCC BAA-1237 / DSM 17374 / SPN1) TaxID=760011 RepID=F4GLZ3_PARC1|nr:RsmE family RNA methyltransferase [Parasphaerochaeta coccoides]AEC03034.1 Ribosomal RNA small subunit methyltransferase E [Parasphaerochaeta coccoides DSM 17374]